jgi:hypothetical protein
MVLQRKLPNSGLLSLDTALRIAKRFAAGFPGVNLYHGATAQNGHNRANKYYFYYSYPKAFHKNS